MAPRLETTGPIGHGFKRILRKRLRKAERLLSAPGDDLATAVHDLRKELKACRSLVRGLRPMLTKREYRGLNAGLRDAGRATAELRDADALADAVDLLARECDLDSDAMRPLRRALERDAMNDAPPQGVADGHEKALRRAFALVRALPGIVAGLDLPDERIGPYVEGLERSYREARKALRHGFATQLPVDLHDARKRVINWRYQLDALAPLWPPLLDAEIAELRALRRQLGGHNDLVLLQARLESDGKPWSRSAERKCWIDRIVATRATLAGQARFASRRLFAEAPGRRAARLGGLWLAVRRDR